ncbi:flagellar motor protein [Rutstroemia sp. NJR-2017a BBW]|nr:flagellar motor protein [Rutstroemia sp. NJR-2017a BBW]
MATTNSPNATNPPNPPNPPKSPSKLPTSILRRKSSSSASIVSSMTSATPSSQTKRTTLPPLTTGQRAAQASRHAQCTHVTTTRLYTKEFRCAICYREGSFGWLYRCTQDRELMLDEHMEKGYPEQEKLDELCDIFPTPPSPRKRSPLARSSKLSFLDEITPEQLKTYTPAQIQLILNQRSQLLEVLNPPAEPNDLKLPTTPSSNRFSFNPFIRNSITPLTPDTDSMPPPTPPARYKSRKSSSPRSPWLPAKGYECQFKCCHACRPTLLDRSYLSLNGVVNGDVPATAITGFSFNLQKFRPVADARIVSNLGFRPVPLPRPVTQSSTQSRRDEQLFARRRLRFTSADTLGLGILSNDSPLISASASSSSTSLSLSSSPSSPPESPSTPPKEPVAETTTAPAPQPESKLLSASPSPILPHAPHPTPLRTPSDSPLLLPSPFRNESESPTSTPLPEQTTSETSVLAIPLTPTGMERRESFEGYFGSQALEVEDGVAVMEEGLRLHVPDVLITQY